MKIKIKINICFFKKLKQESQILAQLETIKELKAENMYLQNKTQNLKIQTKLSFESIYITFFCFFFVLFLFVFFKQKQTKICLEKMD